MSRIQNKSELKTSTLVGISMVAGVGLTNVEVSTWWGLMLSTASVFFQRCIELIGALLPAVEKGEGGEEAAATAAASGSWWPLIIAVVVSFIIGLAIDRYWHGRE